MAIPRSIVSLWQLAGALAWRPLRFATRTIDAFPGDPRFVAQEPSLKHPVSQLPTQSQCDSPLFDLWRRELGLPLDERQRYNRKIWEWIWILQSLETHGLLREGVRGLGFGVGREPLAAVMAKRGCTVLATDLPAAAEEVPEWGQTGQHASQLADLNRNGVCPPDLFVSRVSFRPMDMRALDPLLSGYDFVWSSCALEHLGSLERGLQFIEATLRTLRPGGVAVHTTEYNVGSNSLTLPRGSVVLYRRRDVVALAKRLEAAGHSIELNLHPGSGAIDSYVDTPPYFRRDGHHLKLTIGPFAATSLGICIRRSGGSPPDSGGGSPSQNEQR